MPPYLLWGLAIFALLASFFRAWQTEYRGRLRQESETKALTETNFEIEFRSFCCAPLPSPRVGTICFAEITVANLGAPSVIDAFELKAEIGGVTYPCQLVTIPDNLTFVGAGEAFQMKLSEKDAIYEKASSKPIDTGAKIGGWIRTDIDKFSKQTFHVPGNRIILNIFDVRKKVHTKDYKFTGILDSPKYHTYGSGVPDVTFREGR